MTDEEHKSILKAAVAYAVEETKRVCFGEMDSAMAELTEAHVATAKDAIQRARAEQAAEVERLKAQRDAAILQAQGWKAEAEAHKSTVHEAYQACTGANGEPGNWNGAQPVVNTLAEQAAELARLKSLASDHFRNAERLARELVAANDKAAKWKALAETLAGYVEHKGGCRRGLWPEISPTPHCDCGLSEALTSYKGQRDAS